VGPAVQIRLTKSFGRRDYANAPRVTSRPLLLFFFCPGVSRFLADTVGLPAFFRPALGRTSSADPRPPAFPLFSSLSFFFLMARHGRWMVNGYVAAGESESVGRLRVRWAPIPQSGREEGSPVSTMLMIRFKRCVLKYHHRWGGGGGGSEVLFWKN
jgi:hypothetical protein